MKLFHLKWCLMILIRFFFCHESSIDTHIDTNQLILLSQVRTQKTKKSVADGHLTSSKEVEKMGHVMDICETDSVKKIACWSKCILICTEKENVLLEGNELKDLEAKWLRWGQIWFTKGANLQWGESSRYPFYPVVLEILSNQNRCDKKITISAAVAIMWKPGLTKK